MPKTEATQRIRLGEGLVPVAPTADAPLVVREYLKVRGLALDVLRRVFLAEPKRAFLEACLRSDALTVFSCFEESEACNRGVRDIAEYFDGHDPVGTEYDFDELHEDYTRLFVGPRSPTAPLWASYYLDPEKLLFQQTTLDVRTLYRRHGLVFDGGQNEEADDHLGLELDFLYQMNACMVRMVGEGGWEVTCAGNEGFKDLCEAQKRFVEDHMRQFVPAFTQGVIERSSTLFYRGLARILMGFLEVDARWLRNVGNDEHLFR